MISQKLVFIYIYKYIYIYIIYNIYIYILDIVDDSRSDLTIKDTWADAILSNQEIKLVCETIRENENIKTLNLGNS